MQARGRPRRRSGQSVAAFAVDTLVEEPTHHWLITSPSLSPENSHPFSTSVAAGPALDTQILRDLFPHMIRAAEILERDQPMRAQLAATRARLAPHQIGKEGQLQEWLEDWDAAAPDPHHRHVSHLYALFPSEQITLRGTPAPRGGGAQARWRFAVMRRPAGASAGG